MLEGCNADGSETILLVVIDKSFENVKKFLVEYTAEKKAWKIAAVLTE